MEPAKQDRGRKWVWVFLAAIVGVQIYFVRELLAALLLFTLGFSVLTVLALAFFLAERASQVSMGWAGARTRGVAAMARRRMGVLEYLSKRSFRRPRSEPAQ